MKISTHHFCGSFTRGKKDGVFIRSVQDVQKINVHMLEQDNK